MPRAVMMSPRSIIVCQPNQFRRISGDACFRGGVIATHEEVVAAGHPAWIHHHLVVDCVERLDNFRVRQSALNSFADGIVACEQERGRHSLREIERIGDVDEDFAPQVFHPAALTASSAPAPDVQLKTISPCAAASANVPWDTRAPAALTQATAFALPAVRDPMATS